MTTFNLSSTNALVQKNIKQMGNWAFIRMCKNAGISFEDVHTMILGYPPRVGHLFEFGVCYYKA